MKKSILVTLAFSASLVGALGLSSTTASAAKYRNGLPPILRHTKWHSAKTVKLSGVRAHAKLSFRAKSLYYAPAIGPGAQTTYKLKYKYIGHHAYYITGRVYNNAPKGGSAWKYKVTRPSSHKIYVKDYINGIASGTYYR